MEVTKWAENVRGGRVERVEEKVRAVGLRWEWWDGRRGKSVFVDPDAGPGGKNEIGGGGGGMEGGGERGGRGKGGFGDGEGRKFRGKSLNPDLAREARKPRKRNTGPPDLGGIVRYLKEGDKLPGILFVFSRKGCEDGADSISSWLDGPGSDLSLLDGPQASLADELITEAQQGGGLRLTEGQVKMLMKGVHYHHAGMVGPHRALVERMFKERVLPVLFATTTLAAGVNLPCRTAVVMGMRKRGDEGWADISRTEVRQIAGRAGRRGIDNVGHCLVVPGRRDKLTTIKTLLEGETERVESCFSVRYGLAMAGVRRRGGMRKLVEMNFGTFLGGEGGEEGAAEGAGGGGTTVIDRVREAQAAKTMRDATLRCGNARNWVKEVLLGDAGGMEKEIKKYQGVKRKVVEGRKTREYLKEEGEEGEIEEWLGERERELRACFIEQVASRLNEMKVTDELLRIDLDRLIGEGDVTGEVVKRVFQKEVEGEKELARATKRAKGKEKKKEEKGKGEEGGEVWEEYLALIRVLERYKCIEDGGVGVDEDGVVIYKETEEGEEVRRISANNPLHMAACLGEVGDGKGGDRGEDLRRELAAKISQMTPEEFAGYVSCMAGENPEGGLFETSSSEVNEALMMAAEVSDGVYNAQVEEGVNVRENECNLDSRNADLVMVWAGGEEDWEDVVEGSGRMEGDVARVLMRVADILKQLENKGWDLATDARRLIVKGEMKEYYLG
ncbi:hypothetical protein TrCOL_g3877 [Triparma columacea]|uniref:Helicase C-terminal domain-containing protein n=1 Tax=Triparma columacea TaxID=722753 RepID=A0A9W7GGP4_9STRA|nr:hypothetical protein TrCOL_g3877 [Triparma columacea]